MVHFHSDEERDHLASIGRYVRLWAGVETNISHTISAMYEFLGAEDIEKAQPIALKRRLKFLRKAFKQMPCLSSETENALAILDAFDLEISFRHDLIHGRMVRLYGPHNTPVSHLARPLEITMPMGEETSRSVTSAELEDHYEALGYAGLCFHGVVRVVCDEVRKRINLRA